MATGSTVHRLRANVSDVDRGVYAAIDLRLARHPSETVRYLLTRALVCCLEHAEGLTLGPGLCEPDEPALKVLSADGRPARWIELGVPSAERLHRASKACPEVVVYCHHDPQLLVRECQRQPIHRLATIEAYAVPTALLDALETTLERTLTWEVTRSDGQLYLGVEGRTLEATLPRLVLSAA